MTGWDLSGSARSFSPQVWQVSILLTSSSQLLNYDGILEVSDWGDLRLFLQSLNFVVVFQTCAERKMKFWINDRPARRWSVSGNARCGNTAHSSPWHTGTAIKNRPHVPSQGRQPVPVTAPRHQQSSEERKQTRAMDNTEKLTRWHSESCTTIASLALIEGSKLWGGKKTGKWLLQGSGLTMKRMIQVGNNWAPRQPGLSRDRGRRDAVSWLFFWDISKLLGDNQAKDGS